MTTPTPAAESAPSAVPPPAPAAGPASTLPVPAPPSVTSDGYLAATVGGLVGAFLLTSFGVAAGVALMEIYEDPNGGMANLGLLLYPLALGGLGLLVGLAAGVRIALGRVGAVGATRTAWLTVPMAIVCLFLAVVGGLGVLVLPAVPALARLMVLHTPSEAVR